MTMRKIENGAENEQLLAVAARFAAENLLQHFATALVSALF